MIVEHKTTSYAIDADSTYVRMLPINSQNLTYCWAAREEGLPDYGRVVYDVTRNPPIPRTKVPKTPSEMYELAREKAEFVRVELQYTEQQIDEWHRSAVSHVADIERRLKSNGPWERNDGSCNNYNRECAFLDVCCGRAKLVDLVPTAHKSARLEQSHHSLKQWQACHRLYAYEYVFNARIRTSYRNLRIGDAFHHFLGVRMSRKDDTDIALPESHPVFADGEPIVAYVRGLFDAYKAKWGPAKADPTCEAKMIAEANINVVKKGLHIIGRYDGVELPF